MRGLEGLPVVALPGDLRVRVACGRRARLLGLALAPPPPAGSALLIPRCRSVHTFGMRHPIDLVFLGAGGEVVRVAAAVRPRRLASERRAVAVIETRAGEGGRFARALAGD